MKHHVRNDAGEVVEVFHTCDRCPEDPVTFIVSPMGIVELCWEHTRRFTGWSADEIEAAHAPFLDHIDEAKKRQAERDGVVTPKRRMRL